MINETSCNTLPFLRYSPPAPSRIRYTPHSHSIISNDISPLICKHKFQVRRTDADGIPAAMFSF
jgi:hypothetical protein